jgi:hypothetical protein
MAKIGFETETCGRCGGSGHYSYNMRDGTVCYGCGGSGRRLTKRGAVASVWLRERLTMDVTEVKPGDVVRVPGCTVGGTPYEQRVKVGEVREGAPYRAKNGGDTEWTEYRTIHIIDDKGKDLGSFGEGCKVRRLATADEAATALAYQATLTKAGTMRKLKAS